ncbi:MAG: acyl carrier protein [Gammaproteobacteria bacterium]
METDTKQIEQALRKILSGSVDSSVELASDTDFVSDLGLESIQVLEFIMEVEEHFDIAIDLESLSDVRTVGELTEVVAAAVGD